MNGTYHRNSKKNRTCELRVSVHQRELQCSRGSLGIPLNAASMSSDMETTGALRVRIQKIYLFLKL